MNVGALLIGLALLVLAIPFVLAPFRDARRRGFVAAADDRLDLESQREAILNALRDLDFDHQLGKVAEEDYTRLRSQLLGEAAAVIETLKQKEEALEALIRARRRSLFQPRECQSCGRGLRAVDRFCPGCGQPVGAACPSCGKVNQPGDRFCTACGMRLGTEDEKYLEIVRARPLRPALLAGGAGQCPDRNASGRYGRWPGWRGDGAHCQSQSGGHCPPEP